MQVVAHNLISQFTNRQLNVATSEKAKKAERLSSGYRINRAADDAAGLGISEKLRWQARGLDRSAKNVQDGVSLLQVADGALAEVHSMLDRMKELSVQAANDTNTLVDRQAIQAEVDALVLEIDRIGNDTEYNTLKIFKGGEKNVYGPDGNPVDIGQIPITDLRVGGVDLLNYPFTERGSNDQLNLTVETLPTYTPPQSWDLIFGNGSTSHSSVRVTYMENGVQVTEDCQLRRMSVSDYTADSTGSSCSRKFTHNFGGMNIEIVQKISVGAHDGTKQDYQFSYTVNNLDAATCPAKIEFLFNADTAYNNNDGQDEYYIQKNSGNGSGQRVTNFCVFTDNQDYLNQGSQYIENIGQLSSQKGFSISNSSGALPFSQKFTWETDPNTMVIGRYGASMYEWDRYDDLGRYLGGSTDGRDVAFSMIWAFQDTKEIKFNYGIMDTSQDPNLNDIPMNYVTGGAHTGSIDLWIQSGATTMNGMFITIGELSASELGINRLNMTSYESAQTAIQAVDDAINKVSEQRSRLGAQTNRLEYAKSIDENIAENTQAAESRLRDADMATEMVDYSKNNILEQAGQSLLAQANQIPQGILTLLS